jgi:hypothetical protein
MEVLFILLLKDICEGIGSLPRLKSLLADEQQKPRKKLRKPPLRYCFFPEGCFRLGVASIISLLD